MNNIQPRAKWFDGLKLTHPNYPMAATLTFKRFANQDWIHCQDCDNDFSYDFWKQDSDTLIKAHYAIHNC